jgi:hypothetical protein
VILSNVSAVISTDGRDKYFLDSLSFSIINCIIITLLNQTKL